MDDEGDDQRAGKEDAKADAEGQRRDAPLSKRDELNAAENEE